MFIVILYQINRRAIFVAIPDEFVVVYGIDYARRYRHLPYIGKVVVLDE